MLLKKGRGMKKRKEKKLKIREAPSAEKSTPVGTASPNSDSNSSFLSGVDPSEIEVLAKQDFVYESDEAPKAKGEHKKRKRKKRKGQGEKACPNTSSSQDGQKNIADSSTAQWMHQSKKLNLETQKSKKRDALQNGNGGPRVGVSDKVGKFVIVPTPFERSREVNLETPKPKTKKKKNENGAPSTVALSIREVKDRKQSNIASAENRRQKNDKPKNYVPGSMKDPSSTGIGVAGQEEKHGRKRKIENIFEEAEMCMVEQAVPRKIEEVKQMLKGTKSAALSSSRERSTWKERPDHEDLSFKKPRVDVDASLLETTGEGISSGLTGAQKILEKVSQPALPQNTKLPDIDPNKFIPVKTQKLRTAVPEFEEAGDSESDEDEEQQRINLMEAFADDDIADEFRKEKDKAEEESKPKTVDLRLPGWGSWGGIGISAEKKKRRSDRRNKLVLKFPGVPRKDQGKQYVIINDDPPASFRKQQVDDLPSEFASVAAYEASIRAPIGTTWVPEAAHRALTAPSLVTKMGAIIQPLDESHLIKENAEKEGQKKFNESIKAGRPTKRFKHKSGKPAGHTGPEGGGHKKSFKPAKKRKFDRK